MATVANFSIRLPFRGSALKSYLGQEVNAKESKQEVKGKTIAKRPIMICDSKYAAGRSTDLASFVPGNGN